MATFRMSAAVPWMGVFFATRSAPARRHRRLDEAGGLVARDAGLLGERSLAHAVDDAEVDRLGARAHLPRDLALGDAEDE
jgi:hypothetical protein